MWCYILKNDVTSLIDSYPELSDIFEELILLETEDSYFLPRNIFKQFPSNYYHIYYGKDDIEIDPINLNFTKSLRPDQQPIVKHVLNLYKSNGYVNGIIKARPGLGKTVLSTYIAAKLGLKTLIVVDNSNLLKQWVNAFYNFTNADVNDISIFKQKLYKTDTVITIGMIQTLTRRLKTNLKSTYDTINNNNFGLIIYDEVHNTSSASEFSKGSLLFRTKNILGLSATPFQTGASEILMKNTIGDIIYETTDYELKPTYKFVFYESNIEKKYRYAINKINDYISRKSVYNKAVVESQNYLDLILSYSKHLIQNNHKIMIICMTKKQVTTISEILSKHNIENTMFYGDQKEINYNESVLVSTYSYAGKGFDYEALSAMIIACPLAGKKSIIQTVGRILRVAKDKEPPIVIDTVDMTLPHMFLHELKFKKNIIKNEFKCQIVEENYGDG